MLFVAANVNFFQIGANSGWVISNRGERVRVREVEAVVQTVTNGNNDEQIKTVQCRG